MDTGNENKKTEAVCTASASAYLLFFFGNMDLFYVEIKT